MMRICWARWALILGFVSLFVLQLLAVQPDEVLDDPALEARAREISAQLRCVVCQGESIDSSDAQVARNIRVVLRERLQEGMSDQEVLDYMSDRYGDFILMKPRFEGAGMMLWIIGPLLFLIGLIFVIVFIRKSGQGDWTEDGLDGGAEEMSGHE